MPNYQHLTICCIFLLYESRSTAGVKWPPRNCYLRIHSLTRARCGFTRLPSYAANSLAYSRTLRIHSLTRARCGFTRLPAHAADSVLNHFYMKFFFSVKKWVLKFISLVCFLEFSCVSINSLAVVSFFLSWFAVNAEMTWHWWRR